MEILTDAAANIGFDWRMALAQLVNFLVIFYIVKRFIWPSIKGALETRKQKIEEGLNYAEEAEAKNRQAEEDYSRRIKEADEEAFSIVSDAHEQGKHAVERAHRKAEADSESIVAMGRSQIAQEKVEMHKAFSEEAANLVLAGVEKVLKEKIDAEKDAELIKNALKA